jgi:hypothetical protein
MAIISKSNRNRYNGSFNPILMAKMHAVRVKNSKQINQT